MGTGETRGMRAILDIDVLNAAAARIGIIDHEGLVAHLGMEVTQPASLLLVAVVLLRLPVTLASVLRVVGRDADADAP